MNGTIVVFARAPGKGDAKTRLVPALGPELTARLYRAMLADTLNNARRAGARVVLAHTASSAFPEQSFADAVVEQRGASFGERFDHALSDAYETEGGPIVVIGADTPQLGSDSLRRAFDALKRSQAAIGPSREGGFYLLGFRGRPLRVRETFESANEAAALASAVRHWGHVALLEPMFDIDVPGDLVELILQAELHASLGARAWAELTLTTLADAGVGVEAMPSGGRARRVVVRGVQAPC